ncbi:hypothetical protein [Microbacterium sp.]|uniref:hypothetical protein n=1 Tax=Microbacterium sp. TaxID=51671 RepID=UPI001AC2F0B2|nr:hypothetical protein [Microbacterium sp.]MBN9181731.1 hypothetical protein [Microbacterium sp.]MBN9185988.1 hypothetical protein [Microbacterium sp.]MBN9192197.1 hypothetical protein [Microbacterium sp.]
MRRRAVVLALLLAPLLAGCSQVAAIAPVGGDHLAEVRYAAIDVLLDKGIDVLVAPDCTQAASGAVSCTGKTTDGTPLAATSPADDQTVVTVTVGDRTLYSGAIMTVLDDAARKG